MGSMAHHIYPYIAAPWIRHGIDLPPFLSIYMKHHKTCPIDFRTFLTIHVCYIYGNIYHQFTINVPFTINIHLRILRLFLTFTINIPPRIAINQLLDPYWMGNFLGWWLEVHHPIQCSAHRYLAGELLGALDMGELSIHKQCQVKAKRWRETGMIIDMIIWYYMILIIWFINTVTTFKYVEGGPDREAPEVVWNTSSYI